MSACSNWTTRTASCSGSRQSAPPLAPGFWWLDGARIIKPDKLPESVGMLRLPTDLTVGRVQESFASPDTFSVWALPDFIALLERSGFSAIRHRLHFQALMALPLLAGVMCLVSAGFSMRPGAPRRSRADDRQRRRGRLRAVRGQQGGRRVRPERRAAARTGGLGAGLAPD